jgi:hypothetical protein
MSHLTKKDYELIANVLNNFHNPFDSDDILIHVSRAMANKLENENPLFDRTKFLKACGVTND